MSILPQEDVSIPTTLSVLPKPTELFTIESEVFCNPEDWVRISSELGLTEFTVETTGKSTESKPSLKPRISPTERLIVVDILARERTVVIVLLNFSITPRTATLGIGTLDKGDVDSSQSNVQTNFGLNFNLGVDRGVGLVLGAHARVVGLPGVGKVAH